MSRLNNIQKYAILWLNSQSYTIPQMVEELDISKKQIEYVIKQYQINSIEDTNTAIKTASSVVSKSSSSKNLMITESVGGKHKVAVMTKAASELVDETRKSNIVSTKNSDHIFRPNP